jgi:hypothetical protein
MMLNFVLTLTTLPCMTATAQPIPTAAHFKPGEPVSAKELKCVLIAELRPTLAEFKDRVHSRNLDHLTIWHNVGRDVEHGIWAIAGARMGTYMTMLTNWNYRQVQDFEALRRNLLYH